jgi:hypothetical protein
MTLQSWLVYVAAGIMVVVGLLFGRRGHRVRARDVTGGVVAGEITGSATISNAAAPSLRQGGDRVGWVIAVIGVLIAAAQFAYQVFSPHA